MLPVLWDITNRHAVVVGGGPVGRRKAATLAAARAVVTVVSPGPRPADFDPAAAAWVPEYYRPAHLENAFVVVAAGPADMNARVVTDARAAGILVASATDPAAGDFVFPAVVRRGEFTLAVSTGGAGPAFARRVREKLDAEYDAAFGDFVALLEAVRPAAMLVRAPAARRELLTALAGWDWLARLRTDGAAVTRAAMEAEIRRAGG